MLNSHLNVCRVVSVRIDAKMNKYSKQSPHMSEKGESEKWSMYAISLKSGKLNLKN